MLYTPGLERGYAILPLVGHPHQHALQPAARRRDGADVKERFIELYDVPRYTVGIALGGAIQQYVYAQNTRA